MPPQEPLHPAASPPAPFPFFRVALGCAVLLDQLVVSATEDECTFCSHDRHSMWSLLQMRPPSPADPHLTAAASNTTTVDSAFIITNPFSLSWLYAGECAYVLAVSFVHLLAATFLLAGWPRPRLAAAVCYLCYASRQLRQPFVLSGGDVLFRLSCMWFAMGSDDSSLHTTVNPGLLGARLQICVMYAASVWHKCAFGHALYPSVEHGGSPDLDDEYLLSLPSPWLTGEALRQALSCSFSRKPLGTLLLFAAHPMVCRLLTWLTMAVEASAPVLLFQWGVLRPRDRDSLELRRGFVAFVLLPTHLAMHACLNIGNFSLAVAAALAAFCVDDGVVEEKEEEEEKEKEEDYDASPLLSTASLPPFRTLLCGAVALATVLEALDRAPSELALPAEVLWPSPETVRERFGVQLPPSSAWNVFVQLTHECGGYEAVQTPWPLPTITTRGKKNKRNTNGRRNTVFVPPHARGAVHRRQLLNAPGAVDLYAAAHGVPNATVRAPRTTGAGLSPMWFTLYENFYAPHPEEERALMRHKCEAIARFYYYRRNAARRHQWPHNTATTNTTGVTEKENTTVAVSVLHNLLMYDFSSVPDFTAARPRSELLCRVVITKGKPIKIT